MSLLNSQQYELYHWIFLLLFLFTQFDTSYDVLCACTSEVVAVVQLKIGTTNKFKLCTKCESSLQSKLLFFSILGGEGLRDVS